MAAAVRRWVWARPRGPRWLLAAVAVVLFGLYASNDTVDKEPAAPRGDGVYRPILARGDGHMHFLITRSLVFDRDLNFDNDLAQFGDPWRQPLTQVGRKNVQQPIGASLLAAPLLALADAAAAIGNQFGAGIQRHGYTRFHQRIVFSLAVVGAVLAMLIGARLARQVVGGQWGPGVAAAVITLGTSITYYATYMPSYVHAIDACVVALFLGAWARGLGELRWRRWLALGGWLGLAGLVRTQNVGLGLVLVVEAVALLRVQLRATAPPERLQTCARLSGRLLARGAAAAGVALVCLVPQAIAWHAVYGEWVTSPQGPGFLRLATPLPLEFLFSSRNGWLSSHPLAYLAVLGLLVGVLGVGLVRAARGARGADGPEDASVVPGWPPAFAARVVVLGLVAVVGLQIWINASVYDWWSGASFGQRRMVAMTAPLIVGLAIAFRIGTRLARRAPRWRQAALALVVCGWFVAVNLDQMSRLRGGKTDGDATGAMCCGGWARPLRMIAAPIHRAIGNPFVFPANAIYAVRQDTDLRRWERTVGEYPLIPPYLDFASGKHRRAVAKWAVANDPLAGYVLEGLAAPRKRFDRWWRPLTATRGRLLVPLLVNEPHRITVPIYNGGTATVLVMLRWNDELVAMVGAPPGWSDVRFVTGIAVGNNQLALELAPADLAAAPTLGLGNLSLQLVP